VYRCGVHQHSTSSSTGGYRRHGVSLGRGRRCGHPGFLPDDGSGQGSGGPGPGYRALGVLRFTASPVQRSSVFVEISCAASNQTDAVRSIRPRYRRHFGIGFAWISVRRAELFTAWLRRAPSDTKVQWTVAHAAGMLARDYSRRCSRIPAMSPVWRSDKPSPPTPLPVRRARGDVALPGKWRTGAMTPPWPCPRGAKPLALRTGRGVGGEGHAPGIATRNNARSPVWLVS
jgi:hypothetical protein